MLSLTDNREHYYEPFLGGASVAEKMGRHFNECHYSDAHEDLVMMWDAVVNDDWEPPSDLTEEDYYRLKSSGPSPLRAFAGFACSFGGKFYGGFARSRKTDYAATGRRSVLRGRAMAGKSKTTYTHMSYEDLEPLPGSVIYLDPPYMGTTGYTTGRFDHEKFWSIAERWTKSCSTVLVSEYNAPDGWEAVWEKEQTISLNGGTERDKKSVEKLFIYRNQQ